MGERKLLLSCYSLVCHWLNYLNSSDDSDTARVTTNERRKKQNIFALVQHRVVARESYYTFIMLLISIFHKQVASFTLCGLFNFHFGFYKWTIFLYISDDMVIHL